MARRYGTGYQKYRGRRSAASIILKVIIAVLALVLAAGILFLVFMGEYVEYTDDGVRLSLPWSHEASEPPTQPVDVVVVTPEPTPEPTQAPAVLSGIGAVEVTTAQLTNGTAAQAVADAGGDALVVTMKPDTGLLAWQSKAELAAEIGANAADDSVAQAVEALAESGELYLVARVNCFLDLALVKSRDKGTILLTTGGKIWYDSKGYCWGSPASETVTDYLTALCVELADMGFDEILLDSAGYPDQGRISALATDERRPEDLTVPVAAFYEKVTQALADRDVVVSVQANQRMTMLPEDELYSGITAEALAQYAQRVWLARELSTEQYTAVLEAAGLEDPEKHLVVENGTKESGSWYVTGS